ncbi:glycosyltransferase family 2 protein [Alteromonas gilva]|uniref:Glycosyltransferase family 2 protein n=1 Tax=Alteromonas gilva TaxID=2987522 RepID=A0ABT5L3U9_9ALTE|nr:glycosyltransferase family 2 protein [Alteromonas gilva]MDC8831724.1 glycosyltransferase family 2 protein [Alteromonas gilva]
MKIKQTLYRLKQRLLERSHILRRVIHRCTRQPQRVKLVAVAKNEAAYIPEWIYHHLYFGFDDIEIYYNGCTDNTAALNTVFKQRNVKFICADEYFEESRYSPQMVIYKKALHEARQQGFGYVLFLDLDEYWLPTDCRSSIHTVINKMPYFDLLSFQWRNKVNETLFENAVPPAFTAEKSQQVKTLYKAYLRPFNMNPHNAVDKYLIRRQENGQPFASVNAYQSRLSEHTTPVNAFIVHRKYRSEQEYVAMLGRGRPTGNSGKVSLFKNNRQGFEEQAEQITYRFDNDSYADYHHYMTHALSASKVAAAIKDGQMHVLQRYQQVIALIASAPPHEAALLKRLLRGVTLNEVQQAYQQFLATNGLS